MVPSQREVIPGYLVAVGRLFRRSCCRVAVGRRSLSVGPGRRCAAGLDNCLGIGFGNRAYDSDSRLGGCSGRYPGSCFDNHPVPFGVSSALEGGLSDVSLFFLVVRRGVVFGPNLSRSSSCRMASSLACANASKGRE